MNFNKSMSLRNLSRLCCDEYGVEDGDRKLKEEPEQRTIN